MDDSGATLIPNSIRGSSWDEAVGTGLLVGSLAERESKDARIYTRTAGSLVRST